MKNLICLIVLLSVICKVHSQDLTISFQPKVSDNQIDSIQATNLKTNQIEKLLGGESLLLVKTLTGINHLKDNTETGYIYPNPSNEDATFCFSTNKSQEVEIRLYNISGQLMSWNKQNLAQGTHRFQLKFPAAGIYYLSVLKDDGQASFNAVYTGKMQNSSVSYLGSQTLNPQNTGADLIKSAATGKTLNYKDGDIILYSFFSGKNTTILTDMPATSKTIDVEFVSCIDNDNKSYKVVKIGDQWWMAENLAYLSMVYPPSNGSYTDPRCYVNGYSGMDVAAAKNKTNYATYGVLYNWPAALTAIPPGWHLPNDAEWTALTTFIGGASMAGGKLKETGTTRWNSPNTGATNEYGFAALPAGNCEGAFGYFADRGIWWSSTEAGATQAWMRMVSNNNGSLDKISYGRNTGFSVRCVKNVQPIADFTSSATTITKVQSIQFSDKSTNHPTSWLWDFGDTSASTEQNPLHTYNTAGIYTVSLKVTNNIGSDTKIFTNYITVTDGILVYADKTYKTIIVNGKEWMAENLAYLPTVSPPSAGSTTEPYYYVYDYTGKDVAEAKATANYSTYGVLYNCPAAEAACPPGWHLPSQAEWKALISFLGGKSGAGGKLKESGFTHWLSPNTGATNEVGFTALPAGKYDSNGTFIELGSSGSWWSPIEGGTNNAWYRLTNKGGNIVEYTNGSTSNTTPIGLSVRCVRN
jgi:uncharacterized protein (TIGR02145 family)